MARSKKEQSAIVTALGVQMTIWQSLVESVRKNGGSDEDIYRLATPEGKPVIEEMAKLIARSDEVAAEPRLDTVCIAGYEFEQTTYQDGSRKIELGEFEIDYDELLSDKIAAAKFDEGCVNRDITADNFPFNQTGKHKVCLALLNTGQDVQRLQDFEELATRLERREGDLTHLLAVAQRYPELQRKLYMLATGSRWRNPLENAVVPVLDGNYDLRWLSLDSTNDWLGNAWVLVVG